MFYCIKDTDIVSHGLIDLTVLNHWRFGLSMIQRVLNLFRWKYAVIFNFSQIKGKTVPCQLLTWRWYIFRFTRHRIWFQLLSSGDATYVPLVHLWFYSAQVKTLVFYCFWAYEFFSNQQNLQYTGFFVKSLTGPNSNHPLTFGFLATWRVCIIDIREFEFSRLWTDIKNIFIVLSLKLINEVQHWYHKTSGIVYKMTSF